MASASASPWCANWCKNSGEATDIKLGILAYAVNLALHLSLPPSSFPFNDHLLIVSFLQFFLPVSSVVLMPNLTHSHS